MIVYKNFLFFLVNDQLILKVFDKVQKELIFFGQKDFLFLEIIYYFFLMQLKVFLNFFKVYLNICIEYLLGE